MHELIFDPTYLLNNRGIGRVARDICACLSIRQSLYLKALARIADQRFVLHILVEQVLFPMYVLLRLFCTFRKPVVIFPGGTVGVIAILFCRGVFVLHDLHFIDILEHRRRYTKRQVIGALYRFACIVIITRINCKIVCVSQATKDLFLKSGFVKNGSYLYDRISVISNKVPAPKTEFRTVGGDLTFFSGRSPTKNFERIRDFVINNAVDLTSHYNTIHLIGSDKNISENNINQYEYLDEDDLQVIISESRVVVVPSLMEGFGFPVVEAMSMGAVVVVSRIPAFEELLGDNGFYFDPISLNGLLDALRRVSCDASFMDARSRQSYRYRELYSASAMYELQWRNILEAKWEPIGL